MSCACILCERDRASLPALIAQREVARDRSVDPTNEYWRMARDEALDLSSAVSRIEDNLRAHDVAASRPPYVPPTPAERMERDEIDHKNRRGGL